MFDFSLGELAVIGAVSLVVLGPERLPKVARTLGEWLGKAQRYVSQVKSDINREMDLAELKKLQEEARNAAQSVQASFGEVQGELNALSSGLSGEGLGGEAQTAYDWVPTVFSRRYKPGLSVDELADEVTRLRRQLALPDAQGGHRRKYQQRARVNRTRVRR